MSERLDQARNSLPIEKILQRQERFPQVIARRQAEFNRIGVETEIKWGDSPQGDIALTDSGDKAMAHVEALQTLKQRYDVRADYWSEVLAEAETYPEQLGQVKAALERFRVARPGVVPPHIVERYQTQQQQMIDRPQTNRDFKKALDYVERQKQTILGLAAQPRPADGVIESPPTAATRERALVNLPDMDRQIGTMLATSPTALTLEQLASGVGLPISEEGLASVRDSLSSVSASFELNDLLVVRQEPQGNEPGGFVVIEKPEEIRDQVTPPADNRIPDLETELLEAAAAAEAFQVASPVYKRFSEIVNQHGNLTCPGKGPFRPDTFVARLIAVVTNTEPGQFANFDISKVVPVDRGQAFQYIFGEPEIHYGRLKGLEITANEVLRQVGLQIVVDRTSPWEVYLVIPMPGFTPPEAAKQEPEYDPQKIQNSTFTLPNGAVITGFRAAAYTRLFGSSQPDYANLDLSKLQNASSDELAMLLYGAANSITRNYANNRVKKRENSFAKVALEVAYNDPGPSARARGVRGSYGVRRLIGGNSQEAAAPADSSPDPELLTPEQAGILLFLFTDLRIAEQCHLERISDSVATRILTSLDPHIQVLPQDQIKEQLRFMIDTARQMSETGQLYDWINRHPSEVQEMLMSIGMLEDAEVEKLRAALAEPATVINLHPDMGEGTAKEEGKTVKGEPTSSVNGEAHQHTKDHLTPFRRVDREFNTHVDEVVRQVIAAFGESDRSILLNTKVLGTLLSHQFRLTKTHCDRYKNVLGIDTDEVGGNQQYSLVDVCLLLYLHRFGRNFSVHRRDWKVLTRHFEQILTRESQKYPTE